MNIATKPHSRSMRQPNRGYERSFFIRYNFLRVVMDEVQLLGERTSKASLTCALIARKFSLAVSGTPLLHKIEDVQPLLRFLRMEPLGTSRAALSRMLKDKELFERVVGVLGERTTKIAVQHEISLPTQSRYLVPVEFEAVERYSYDGRYNAALEELGFDLSTGAPKENYDANGYEIPWVPEKQVMVGRSYLGPYVGGASADRDSRAQVRWLSILRLLCIHPQGGQGGQLGLAKVKHVDGQAGGNLGTLEETLARMLQNLKSTANTNKRALTAAKVSRGLYTMHDRENCTRFEDAINLFAEARSYLQPVIEEVIESINALWLERKAEASVSLSRSPSRMKLTFVCAARNEIAPPRPPRINWKETTTSAISSRSMSTTTPAPNKFPPIFLDRPHFDCDCESCSWSSIKRSFLPDPPASISANSRSRRTKRISPPSNCERQSLRRTRRSCNSRRRS